MVLSVLCRLGYIVSPLETPAAFGLTVVRTWELVHRLSPVPLPTHNRVKYLTLIGDGVRGLVPNSRAVAGTYARTRVAPHVCPIRRHVPCAMSIVVL